MRFQSTVAMNPELMPKEHVQRHNKATNVKTVALVGINPSTVSHTPCIDMIKDLICAIIAAFAFVAIWILAAII
jgi:hypothetical protein